LLSSGRSCPIRAAAQRDDPAPDWPSSLTGRATSKVVVKLLAEGLVEQIQSHGSLPAWRRDRDNARGPRLTNCQRGRPPFGEIAPAHSGIPPTRQGTRTRQTRAGSKTLPTATRSCDAKLYGVDADQAL